MNMSCHGTAMVRSSILATTSASLDSTGKTSSWRECPRVMAGPTSASPGRARCLFRTLCKSSSKVKYVHVICWVDMQTNADQEPQCGRCLIHNQCVRNRFRLGRSIQGLCVNGILLVAVCYRPPLV